MCKVLSKVVVFLTVLIGGLGEGYAAIYEYGHDGLVRDEKNIMDGFMNMYNPHVIQIEDTDYPFLMWFFGWVQTGCNEGLPGCDAIYAARSRDMREWEVYCGDGRWDSQKKGFLNRICGLFPVMVNLQVYGIAELPARHTF